MIKAYGSLIFPDVLCRCETCSFALQEEHMPRNFVLFISVHCCHNIRIRALLSQYQININKCTDMKKIKFIETRQGKHVYRYKNIKEKIHTRVQRFGLTKCVKHTVLRQTLFILI
jgi:hypothetical protein